MRKNRHPKWRKLDNAAQAFPAATSKGSTRVFRMYCELKEEILPQTLQAALEQTLEKYPMFCAVLRKGLFWFYLEHREITANAEEESQPPCSMLYIPDQKNLLFEVSYYKNRINFEVFHGLTDGTGALNFIKELVKNYLTITYPDKDFSLPAGEDTETGNDHEEDSFSQYYSNNREKSAQKRKKAYQLRGEKLEQDEIIITELTLSAGDVHRKAKSCGVSVTVFLSAALLWAIHEEMPKSQYRKPVTLMIPVNLRNYFPSDSMSNFFGWIEAGYTFEEETSFSDVLQSLKITFSKELVKEKIAQHMNYLVSLEKNPLLRAVPLEIKNLFLLAGTTRGSENITAIFSNLGRICLPEIYSEYVESFGFFSNTDKLQMCSCSFGDRLRIGLTSKFLNENIQRNFLHILRSEGLACEEMPSFFPDIHRERKNRIRKGLQIFSFLCAAAVVISWMIDLMLTRTVLWSGFLTAGVFCTWLVVMVGYHKRRNPLKNGMWQLLIISAACVLWDFFTGWKGWSLDFILPLTALVVMISMFVIAKVCRLEEAEYLFYLVQISVFSFIPGIFYLTGMASLPYPSLICSGIGLLLLIGIIIFRSKSFIRELQKKFRV